MSLPGPGASPFSGLTAEASPGGGEGLALDRVKVLAGRLFDPADPNAVMISQRLADREHLRPGGTLDLIGYPQRHGSPCVKHQVRLAFRVSAVVPFTDQIVAGSYPRLLLSPAFARTRQAMSFNPAGGGIYVVLRPGAAGPRSPARPRPWPRVTRWGTPRSSTWPPRMRQRSGRSGRKRPRWRSSPSWLA